MVRKTINISTISRNTEDGNRELPNSNKWFNIRYLQVLLSFLLIFIAYGFRANLSVAIVAMTTNSSSNPDVPVYNWQHKSIVLGSFFWGYIIPQLPAGYLTQKVGPKWFLITSIAICSLLSLLTPILADSFGTTGVIIVRVLQGICQGFIFPNVHTLLSKWVPTSERSRLGAFVYSGGHLGNVVAIVLAGIISASWQGWPLIFYLYGLLGIIWSILMGIFGYNEPSQCSIISENEKAYLATTITERAKNLPTPWLKMFTSLPVWAIVVAHSGTTWGFITLLTQIPTYMGHVLNLNIQSSSYLSAMPFLTLWLLSFFFSIIADCLINSKFVTITTTRKIFTTVGHIVPAIALICLCLVDKDQFIWAIALLIIAVAFNSAIYSGFVVNHMDIAPNFAGILMSFSNCLANLFACLAPLVVNFAVKEEDNAEQWQIVFIVTAAMYIATAFFYLFSGAGDLQTWNSNEEKSEKIQA